MSNRSSMSESSREQSRLVLANICDRFEVAWKSGEAPQIEKHMGMLPKEQPADAARKLLIDLVSIDLEWRWRRASEQSPKQVEPAATIDVLKDDAQPGHELPDRPLLQHYLCRYPTLGLLQDLPVKLICHEYFARRRWGDCPAPDEYIGAFGHWHPNLHELLSKEDESLAKVLPPKPEPDLPERIGRYRIDGPLGKGGFGVVYQAYDERLDRPVAIKVAHAKLVRRPEDAGAYLREARTVAGLDHRNIVPVYDAGSTDQFPCYIVSKYIDSLDLAKKLAMAKELMAEWPSPIESAQMVRTVAEALHYAHTQGLVHRDIKPGNILIDANSKPYVADFGLALKETELGKGPRRAGTPAYMSPEQARGEGHRVDGRSDIYSLGAVLYELLTGRRTFASDSVMELLELIATQDPKPPRQIDDRIPSELERVCLKALSQRGSDRYTTAKDMANDLRQFIAECELNPIPASNALDVPHQADTVTNVMHGESSTVSSDNLSIRIVPKGLRSFDRHDSSFFLELLPGARDRDGLPDEIRFWKTRIEEQDSDETFKVGVMYGPSGCGKSSLVKAGLLPRLSQDVIAVYVESAPEETEVRLLSRLRKFCTGLPFDLDLPQTLQALRRGRYLPVGKKVLIILDQFEQWLHSTLDEERSNLVQALRQCDGSRVQCIVMVRDDFWMATTHFLHDVEVPLLEGRNSAAVDLFPLRHARRVLAAFGRAFEALPENTDDVTADQREFLKHATSDLAEDGKVIPVRLALFAEMMKGRAWTKKGLDQVGGIGGVGVTFLDETFSAKTAPPTHRLHEKAVRGILRALLPGEGTDIKGQMKSYNQLLQAAGYVNRRADFETVLDILDGELRLLTPTELDEMASDSGGHDTTTSAKFYQLTHDYLVPSLREWLTRKQKETRRGRAELRVAELSASWNAKPENRYLPSWWEYLNIRLVTMRKSWSEPERALLRKAGRLHAVRGVALLLLVGMLSYGGFEISSRLRANALVDGLEGASPENVLEFAQQLSGYRRWAEPPLRQLVTASPRTPDEHRRQLHARLALLHYEPSSQIAELERAVLTEKDPAYLGVIQQSLHRYRQFARQDWWEVFHDRSRDSDTRFRAGLVLAGFEPDSENWTEDDARFLVDMLVTSNPVHQPVYWQLLAQIEPRLFAPLKVVFSDASRGENQLIAAANALAYFIERESKTDAMVDLLVTATVEQYAILIPLFEQTVNERSLEELVRVVNERPADGFPQKQSVATGKRKAYAAVTLLRQGRYEDALASLRVKDDPESVTQFVSGCATRGVTADDLVSCVEIAERGRRSLNRDARQAEDRVIFGLFLALGEFGLEEISSAKRSGLVDLLEDLYSDDPSSTIHGATGWLLRHWGIDSVVHRIDETPIPYDRSGKREWFVVAIDTETDGDSRPVESSSAIFLTFVVYPSTDYLMGSVPTEFGRDRDEQLHKVSLTRPIAVCDREVTWIQFNAFDAGAIYRRCTKKFERESLMQGPAFGMNWQEAVDYCCWLTQKSGMPENSQCYEASEVLTENEIGSPSFPSVHLDRAGFRLPTEAEWEYINRSGTRTAYSFGNDEQQSFRYGWCSDNSDGWSHEVAKLRPNLRGIYDMHGNVFEWCHDWYQLDLSDCIDPTGPQTGSATCIRGGGWYYAVKFARSSIRTKTIRENLSEYIGFRLVFSLPD